MRRVIAPPNPVAKPSPTPSATQTPEPTPTPPPAPRWETTEWTSPEPGCADFTATRTATCMVGSAPAADQTACGARPDETKVVQETRTCGYDWATTLYQPSSGCARDVKQTRTATCTHLLYYGAAKASDETLCTKAKPILENTVDLADDCKGAWEVQWQPVDTSTCSGTIEQPGVHACWMSGETVDDYNCTGKPRPADTSRTLGCTNLVLNGGFETSAAWLLYERTSYNTNAAYVRSGTRSMKAWSVSTNGYGPYQMVSNLVKGRSYTIAGWYMAPTAPRLRCLTIKLECTSWTTFVQSAPVVANPGCGTAAIPWTRVSTTFTATDTTIRFGYLLTNSTGSYTDGDVYFDDVSVTAN